MSEPKHTPGPWYYVTGAVWTTPNGPDDGGACIAQRTNYQIIQPCERDANMRLCSRAPSLLAENERLREALRGVVSAYDCVNGREQRDLPYAMDAARSALSTTERSGK